MNITTQEYIELQDAKEKLYLLEIGGVDNWEFYGEALDSYKPASELYAEAEDFLNELTEGSRIDYPAGRDAGHQIIFDEKALEMVVGLLKERK